MCSRLFNKNDTYRRKEFHRLISIKKKKVAFKCCVQYDPQRKLLERNLKHYHHIENYESFKRLRMLDSNSKADTGYLYEATDTEK